MATVADLKEKIIRATGGRYMDQTYMLQLLNDALTDLTDEAKLINKATIPVVANQDTYALPSDFKTPRTLLDEVTIPNDVIEYPLIDITENGFGYAVWNGNTVIKPTPQKAMNLSLYYYQFIPDLVNDTSVPAIDQHYHNLLAQYAIMMICLLPELNLSAIYSAYSQQWADGKRQFVAEMEKKRKLDKVREKIVW